MAAPSYTEDLTDITLAESTTNWIALGGGASGLAIGPDFAMEGTNCVDKQVTAAEKGQVFNFGTTITPGTNTHFFIWVFLATPGLANSLQNRGLTCVLGTATTAYNQFHVEGNDTYGAAGRVAKCYPIRYVTTANASPPYRTLTGTPGANPQYFGAMANITGTVKGSNLGVDAMRYGTGGFVTAGEVANPATFAGFATTNDTITNRWGILTAVGGAYELQGRFVVGQNNAGTPTLAYFVDSNRFITIVDTPHSLTDFTQIIVDHASTVFNLTNVTILALGTNNPGRLIYNNASTVSSLTGCAFDKLGITTLRAGVTATNCTWRSANLITQNGATLTSCNISSSPVAVALLADDPDLITYCEFTSSGTGHAVQCDTVGTYGWVGNLDTGYTGTRGSNPTPNSGSANAMFYNNSGGLITLNVSGGGQSPSVRNGINATTVVNNVVIYTVAGVETNSEVRIYNAQNDTLLDGIENTTGQVKVVAINSGGTGYTIGDTLTVVGGTGTAATLTVSTVSGGVITGVTIATPGSYSVNPTNPVSVTGGTGSSATFFLTISGSFAYSYSYSGDIPIYIVVFNTNFKDVRLVNRTLTNTNQTDTVQMIYDRVYSNPA